MQELGWKIRRRIVVQARRDMAWLRTADLEGKS
jgi:hypothetical protein